jgi:DNA primase
MRIPDRIIAEIADRLDMAEVVSGYVPLTRKQGRYWGLCPFHQEKTPSFSVNPEKGIFYCFGCKKGGTIYRFIMEMEKLSFVEAVRHLAEKAGVQLPAEEESPQASLRDASLELYRRVAASLHYILLNRSEAKTARDYLQGRGFGQEVIDRYEVGYAPADRNWLWQFLREKSYSEEFLRGCGLFLQKEERVYPYFWDRVMFPISNARGEVIGFGGRALADRQPKYLNSPETPLFHKGENLFGLHQAHTALREKKEFILVEGYMDVLAMSQSGIDHVVAPLGTALTEHQIRLLKRYGDRGILLFDADEAGFQATRKAVDLLEKNGVETGVAALPEGSDPADIMVGEGADKLQELVKCPINSFQFLLRKAMAQFNIQTPDGKEKTFQFLAPTIAATESQVRRDGYFRLLGEALGVDFESVRHDFLSTGRQAPRPARAAAPVEERVLDTPELFLMMAVAGNRELFPLARGRLTLEDLEDPRARALYIALEECLRSDEQTLEALLERIEDPALRNHLLGRLNSGEFAIHPELLVQDGINRIRRRNLERRMEQLVGLLARSAAMDPGSLKELLGEKMYLDEELEKLKVYDHDRTAE